ncbi:MAG: methyltransferase, partial [Bryobacteraceae bacterium]
IPPPVPRIDRPAEAYRILLAFFRDAGFATDSICERLGISALHEIEASTVGKQPYGEVLTAADALTVLFVEGRSLSPAETAVLSAGGVAQMADFGLIAESADGIWTARVALTPVENLYVATDRFNEPDGTAFNGWDDLVYPCIFRTTRLFLEQIPRSPCEDVLDLCSGCGVGALLSSAANRTWAADITDRARDFARFNALLNGIENMNTLTGDMYEPSADAHYDRIVAHPPYQPVVKHSMIFNSGGLHGEELTSRIIEGAPAHLRPGGRLYCLCQVMDRDVSAEHRIREWLGTGSEECDLVFIVHKSFEIQRYTALSVLRSGLVESDWLEWMRQLTKWKVKEMNYGMVVVQKRESRRPVFTVRRENGSPSTFDDLQRLLDWETHAARPGFEDYVMQKRFRTRKSSRLQIVHGFESAAWEIQDFRILNDSPWDATIAADQPTAHLMSLLTGERNGAACLREFRQAVDASPAEFAQRIRVLVSGGFVEQV